MGIDTDLLYRELGARLRERRTSLGITQEKLAERSGVSRASIAIIERGKQRSPLHIIYQLCDAMDLEVTAILPSNKEVSDRSSLPIIITDEVIATLPKTSESVEHFRRLLEERPPYGS